MKTNKSVEIKSVGVTDLIWNERLAQLSLDRLRLSNFERKRDMTQKSQKGRRLGADITLSGVRISKGFLRGFG